MSRENLPGADQASTSRRFVDWIVGPWTTGRLIACLVAAWLILTGINWIVFDIGRAGVARGALALLIVGGLGVIWSERRSRRRG